LAVAANARIVRCPEEEMHQAANVQFERAVDEFAQWRTIPEDERSPAPGWWWGPALEVVSVRQPMPVGWCKSLQLPAGAAYVDGAQVFLKLLSGQTSLPWPYDFPRRPKYSIPA
jgi:hypothetical protein